MATTPSLREYAGLLRATLRRDRIKASRLNVFGSCPNEILDHVTTLKRDGIVIIPDHVKPERCDELLSQIDAVIAPLGETTELPSGAKVSFRGGGPKSGKHVNEGADTGMIDIFDADLELEELRTIRTDAVVRDIVRNASHAPVEPTSLHVYVNNSITRTRGYHMDSVALQYKAFVYLTDVREEADGPYSFIRGSHRFSVRKYLNLTRNLMSGYVLTEMSGADPSRIVHAIAPRGTLIISDQNGWHRGLPQVEGRRRMLVSVNYAVV